MTLRLLLLVSLSLPAAWQAARAQTAEDFFNGGAQLYISNNIPSALERVESGRKLYPDDVKLKKLEELLKQQQQSQSQQNPQNQSRQQQQQKNQQQSQQQQQQNQQQNQNQEAQGQPDQKKADQQKQPQESPAQGQNEQKQENQKEQGQPVAAGQMTPAEAKRLLDAQKGDEQVLQWKPPGKPEDQNRPVKDW